MILEVQEHSSAWCVEGFPAGSEYSTEHHGRQNEQASGTHLYNKASTVPAPESISHQSLSGVITTTPSQPHRIPPKRGIIFQS